MDSRGSCRSSPQAPRCWRDVTLCRVVEIRCAVPFLAGGGGEGCTMQALLCPWHLCACHQHAKHLLLCKISDAECIIFFLFADEGAVSDAFSCIEYGGPYHRCPRRPPLEDMPASLGGTGEALPIPGACPWGWASPRSAGLCQPSQGTASLLLCPGTGRHGRQQCHGPRSSVVGPGSWKSVGVGLVLLMFFQFRS